MSDQVKISGKNIALPEVDSQEWKLTVRPGGWVIAESSMGIRKKMMLFEQRGCFSVSLAGYLWLGEWVQQNRSASAQGVDSDLIAQFPGKVRKILVQVDALVLEGDPLVLMEAMKMEFSIRAPYSGRVTHVLVQEGQQLFPGDRLIELEASGEN